MHGERRLTRKTAASGSSWIGRSRKTSSSREKVNYFSCLTWQEEGFSWPVGNFRVFTHISNVSNICNMEANNLCPWGLLNRHEDSMKRENFYLNLPFNWYGTCLEVQLPYSGFSLGSFLPWFPQLSKDNIENITHST